ncbi:sensor histidine kinase [Corynebacterium pseudodiphtheriticum]|uniref:sensor histidine kinase n=1 Tax=Corynebacterium pseudodiphtheriticum TaxID=37637 RepID=UPI002543B78C|nr:sensor histidine kinase [Corynebacterium pseudodiphtheriticum]MDK4241483.1 sensor histidine kinase [Corynebacterium pseudodiphtheriticum]
MNRSDSFRRTDFISASVSLLFLSPLMVQVYTAPQLSTGDKAWVTVCVGSFAAFYSFAFGSLDYFPRGWDRQPRALLRWSVLLAIALATAPVISIGVANFAPFLAAMLGFTLPLKKSLPIVVATGVIGAAAVWLWAPQNPIWPAVLLFGIPLGLVVPVGLVVLGAFIQYEESRDELRHKLDLAQQREDIATDVHDLLGHSLTVINLKSEVARRAIDSNPEQARQELNEISELSRTGLAEVRSTVTRMRTPTFAGELQAARRALETKEITAHLPEPLTTPGAHDSVFSWALRELTTNVLRHSGATECWISITNTKLQVKDNGCGFQCQWTHTKGGLSGLRDRIEAAGGRLIIQRKEGLSTVLVSMSDDNTLIDNGAVTEESTP